MHPICNQKVIKEPLGPITFHLVKSRSQSTAANLILSSTVNAGIHYPERIQTCLARIIQAQLFWDHASPLLRITCQISQMCLKTLKYFKKLKFEETENLDDSNSNAPLKINTLAFTSIFKPISFYSSKSSTSHEPLSTFIEPNSDWSLRVSTSSRIIYMQASSGGPRVSCGNDLLLEVEFESTRVYNWYIHWWTHYRYAYELDWTNYFSVCEPGFRLIEGYHDFYRENKCSKLNVKLIQRSVHLW